MKRADWKKTTRFLVEMFFIFTMAVVLAIMASLLLFNVLWGI